MAAAGVDHFHVELICNFPCATKEELLAEEGRHIRVNDMVKNGCNMNVAGQELNPALKAAREKAYRGANTEKMAEYAKKYQEKHKDTLKAYLKTYNEANEERRKAQKKTYQEEHTADLAIKRKEYQDTHKAELAAYKKAYYLRKKAERLAANQPVENTTT